MGEMGDADIDASQWRDIDALVSDQICIPVDRSTKEADFQEEITQQTRLLIEHEFTFLADSNDNNDTPDASVLIDTSRLSDMYDERYEYDDAVEASHSPRGGTGKGKGLGVNSIGEISEVELPFLAHRTA
jgi:hypothetical protein